LFFGIKKLVKVNGVVDWFVFQRIWWADGWQWSGVPARLILPKNKKNQKNRCFRKPKKTREPSTFTCFWVSKKTEKIKKSLTFFFFF